MWGFKSFQNRDLANKIYNLIINSNSYKKSDGKGYDQYFLKDKVYSLIRHNSIIHDSYLCKNYQDSDGFPSQRKGNCFVGQLGECNLNGTYYQCPLECRPKLHQDWKNC